MKLAIPSVIRDVCDEQTPHGKCQYIGNNLGYRNFDGITTISSWFHRVLGYNVEIVFGCYLSFTFRGKERKSCP